MQRESGEEKRIYKVECSWCGAIIRRNSAKESRGMCLKCYARMLSEHSSSHEPSRTPRRTSDR